jgi:DNA repair protein RecN (Recombination protein N)
VLVELRIQDFAVIEAVAIEFGPGLNVLTGETGAGKSIIVDALTAALGARASAEVVRTGRGAARVEARFAVGRGSPAAVWLADQGFEDDDLVVAREISTEGRSRAWINGRPATAGMLRDLGEMLVEVAGQHEGQRLLQPQTHLELLDAFAGEPAQRLRQEVADGVSRRASLRAEQRALVEDERDRLRQMEVLRHQVAEIDAARLRAGEEEELAIRRTRLANAERLAGAAGAAYAVLYEADGAAAVDRLGQARSALRDAAALDPALAEAAGRVEALAAEVADVAHGLSGYIQGIDARPDELAAVEDRLELLRSLRRKYGESVEAILAYRDDAAARVAGLEARDERLAGIASDLEALERDLADRCARLSSLRREAAARLVLGVERTLQSLEMARTRLEVEFSQERDPDGLRVGDARVSVWSGGIDRVEFLLSANPGEAPRPLARIASGGELSRLMLALRHVLAEAGAVPVMVCDEVDAGVGSRTAGAVGQLLAAVSRSRQVLCVTHLPQIASMADRHFWVVKETSGGRTRVRVRHLGAQERLDEVARMLGGRRPTPIAREHAAELLTRAGREGPAGGAAKGARGGRA